MATWLHRLWGSAPSDDEPSAAEGHPPSLADEAGLWTAEEQALLHRVEDHLCNLLELALARRRHAGLQGEGESEAAESGDSADSTAAEMALGLPAGTTWTHLINWANRQPDEVAARLLDAIPAFPREVQHLLTLRGAALTAHLEMACRTRPSDWADLLAGRFPKHELAPIRAGQELARAEIEMIAEATKGSPNRNPTTAFPGAERSPLVRLHHFIHEQYRMTESRPIAPMIETHGPAQTVRISAGTAKLTVNIGHLTAVGDSWLLIGAWTSSRPMHRLSEVLVRARLARDLVATGADPSCHAALAPRNAIHALSLLRHPNDPWAPVAGSLRNLLEAASPTTRHALCDFPEALLALAATALAHPSVECWKVLSSLGPIPPKTFTELIEPDTASFLARMACRNSSEVTLLDAQLSSLVRLGFPVDHLLAAWAERSPTLGLPPLTANEIEKRRAEPATRKVVLTAKLRQPTET